MSHNFISISLSSRRGYLVFALAVLFVVFASVGSAQGLTNSASERAGIGQNLDDYDSCNGLGSKTFLHGCTSSQPNEMHGS